MEFVNRKIFTAKSMNSEIIGEFYFQSGKIRGKE